MQKEHMHEIQIFEGKMYEMWIKYRDKSKSFITMEQKFPFQLKNEIEI